MKNGQESIFEITLLDGELSELNVRYGKLEPLDKKDEAVAEAFVRKYYKNIVDKWVNFFVYKKKVRVTKITRKL
jgi:hypothetical protein